MAQAERVHIGDQACHGTTPEGLDSVDRRHRNALQRCRRQHGKGKGAQRRLICSFNEHEKETSPALFPRLCFYNPVSPLLLSQNLLCHERLRK